MAKTIKIKIYTNGFYAKFIAIWRPEEAADYVPDPTAEAVPAQQSNIPYLLVTQSMFEARAAVKGANPVAPSVHPMPEEFMQQQVRHISYMFANEFGIWQAPSKADSEEFLAKAIVNYTLAKEYDVTVSPAQGNITLKAFKDSLSGYTDEQLESIKVMTIGEHPDDAHAKGIEDYIHTMPNSTTEQYYSITKLTPVYELANTELNNSILPEDPTAGGATGTLDTTDMTAEDAAIVNDVVAGIEDAQATAAADVAVANTFEAMTAPDTMPTEEQLMADSTTATETPVVPTKEEAQAQTIKDLQAEIDALKAAANTTVPGAV